MFLKRLFLVLFSLMFCLFLLGLIHYQFDLPKLLQKLAKEFREAQVTPTSEVYKFDPELGWVGKPNKQYTLSSSHFYEAELGPNGFRGTHSLSEADVVVVGDSFSFGVGVDEKDHFQYHANGMKVKSIGLPGYNLVQAFLLLQKYKQQLKGKTIVYFVFYGNDFYESIQENMMKYTTPYLKRHDGRWEIKADHISSDYLDYNMDEHQLKYFGNLGLVCSLDGRANAMYEATNVILSKVKNLCDQLNAKLVVMGIPEMHQLTKEGHEVIRKNLSGYLNKNVNLTDLDIERPNRELKQMCHEKSIPFIAMSDELDESDYGPDLHWTVQGHQKVGEMVLKSAL